MTATTALLLSETDNVAVVLANITKGEDVPAVGLTAREAIPRGHKVAVTPIKPGDAVHKYGQVIGFASAHIAPGEHVHTHNVAIGESFERDYAFGERATPTEMVPEGERATFQGYVREDGKIGTRNYVGIVTSVNCSATAARRQRWPSSASSRTISCARTPTWPTCRPTMSACSSRAPCSRRTTRR